MTNLRRKADIIFYKISLISFLFLFVFIFINILLKSRLSFIMTVWGDKLAAACGCTNHWVFSSHPWMFSFLILATGLVLAFVIYVIVKVISLNFRTKVFIKSNLKNKKRFISEKIRKVATSLNLQDKIFETRESSPIVFCYGFFSPKICISSALVKRLSEKELKAVLLHEKHHLIHHETIKLFVVKTISTSLFFIPGIKALSNQYHKLSEVSADEWAIRNSDNKSYLARAMYKVLRLREGPGQQGNLAVASFGLIIEERINKITDDNYVIKINIIKSNFLLNSFAMLAIVFVFIFILSTSNMAIAEQVNGVCAMDHNSIHQDCSMSESSQLCDMEGEGVQLEKEACNIEMQQYPFYNNMKQNF